jgi:deoxyribonuclease IV
LNYKRNTGLHLRLKSDLTTLAMQAKDFGLKIFQFFLTRQEDGKYIKITQKDREGFLRIRRKFFSDIYIHSSYWINLPTGNKISAIASEKLLKKEISIAKKLEARYLVLHPGSARGHRKSEKDPLCKMAGIKSLTTILNRVLDKENDVEILLENTAHANRTIGSNIKDFILIKEMLEQPEKVNFCIDLAHAFAYSYDLAQKSKFIELLDKTMGLEKIKLIHLHDSAEKKGSKLDKHEIPGKGHIGKKILKSIINHKNLKKIPVILELPAIDKKETINVYKDIKGW